MISGRYCVCYRLLIQAVGRQRWEGNILGTGEILSQTDTVIGVAAAVRFLCTLGWPPALRTELGPIAPVFPVVVLEVCATMPATALAVKSALCQLSYVLYLKSLL